MVATKVGLLLTEICRQPKWYTVCKHLCNLGYKQKQRRSVKPQYTGRTRCVSGYFMETQVSNRLVKEYRNVPYFGSFVNRYLSYSSKKMP